MNSIDVHSSGVKQDYKQGAFEASVFSRNGREPVESPSYKRISYEKLDVNALCLTEASKY